MKIERQWLWNRLQAMSVSEIVHRVRRLAVFFLDSLRYRLGWLSRSGADVRTGQRDLFQHHMPEYAENSLQVPEKLASYRTLWLNNTVQLFSTDAPLSLGAKVQWLTDPKTGIETPRRFGRSIDYRDDQCVGEIKFLWELGRHQFLVPMAVQAALYGDDAVKAKLSDHLESWMEQNPVGMGIHWCSSLEVSLRLISWCLVHSILQAGGAKQGIFELDCDADSLKTHLFCQVDFVTGNYSRFSSANNHLIGELTGVWVTCNVFELGSKGERWREAARVELEREIHCQTHDDGVNKEQAIYYHLWSLEYFWLSWLVAKRYERPVSASYEASLVKMYIFLDAMCSPTPVPSQIGDADGGVVCRFSPDISENVYKVLLEPMAQVLGDKRQCLPERNSLYSKSFWYRNSVKNANVSSITQAFENQLAQSADNNAFESGGYYLLRGQHCHLLFKAGPFGYLATAAHSHADALSVTLAIEDQWWLIDPGTYTYHSSGEWRNYFRSTLAHNTLCVNQLNQSEIAGDFLWSRQTDAHVHCIERHPAVSSDQLSTVSASHAGYADQGVTHERTVKCDGVHTFNVEDQLYLDSDKGEVNSQLAFHFHPEVKLQQLDTHRWLATRQNSIRAITLDLPAAFDWVLHCGGVNPKAGWYSETYGVKVPCNALLGRTVVRASDSSAATRYRTELSICHSEQKLENSRASK